MQHIAPSGRTAKVQLMNACEAWRPRNGVAVGESGDQGFRAAVGWGEVGEET